MIKRGSSMNAATHQDDATHGHATPHLPYAQTSLVDPADRIARGDQSAAPVPLSTAECRALLVSAAVLMEEALRLLDRGGCSIAGVWLAHARECLEHQLQVSG